MDRDASQETPCVGCTGHRGGSREHEIQTKSKKRRCDLSAPPGGPALSARVRSLLAACPSWRTRFSAPRMHLLAPRALGAKLHALTAYLRRSDGDAAPPPTNQFARQVAGPVRGRGRGRAPNTEETAYFRERKKENGQPKGCLLYTSPSPRDS